MSMNKGKLDVVQQEMARMNNDILGIQMTIILTTVGKNPLEEMEQPSETTKESGMQYLGAILKTTE